MHRAMSYQNLFDNETKYMRGKDAYMKNSAQEFIRMLSQSTSILANFALKDILR